MRDPGFEPCQRQPAQRAKRVSRNLWLRFKSRETPWASLDLRELSEFAQSRPTHSLWSYVTRLRLRSAHGTTVPFDHSETLPPVASHLDRENPGSESLYSATFDACLASLARLPAATYRLLCGRYYRVLRFTIVGGQICLTS